ncbi:MAG TPA: molybdopterin converting factor subunit 1 [Pirellulaceae bacterium]|nr:molybdopterin converting factor subunit 1 [Pirellulaceae bacterium]
MPVHRVKLFAGLREAAGTDLFEWEAPAGATVADLRAELTRRFPQTAALAARSFAAVDREYAVDTRVLSEGAEIAFIPPVSGGA